MDDKRRRTTVPVKIGGLSGWILDNATGEQLSYINSMAKSGNFRTFISLVDKVRYYNVYTVFEFVAKDDESLESFRMFKKGEVAMLDALIIAANKAGDEMERRKKVKK